MDPALGLNLVPSRELQARQQPVSICVPAHNEAATITEVVHDALRALKLLGADGEVIVAASACTDDSADLAERAGARVIECGRGKGVALKAGVATAKGDIIATVDGDFRYFGPEPIAATLLRPILSGTADATIADLYWRPLYPQLTYYGFFAPLAGRLYPEMLAKVGTTPWSGQRAAIRPLWNVDLPDDFTVEMALNLAWNDSSARVRPVLSDDWTNPQRPKPDLLRAELEVILAHAISTGRLRPDGTAPVLAWFNHVHDCMATYQPGADDPAEFETRLLRFSTEALAA
ncbi:glycosyl transferase [Pseudofrankia sp. BMG5.36]|nr:glycosyl transferase [Pseudofrankia sp. BMG5.36]